MIVFLVIQTFTFVTHLFFKQMPTMNISIRCEDSGHPVLFHEKWFTIDVKDVNERPTDVLISGSIVGENTPPGGIGLFLCYFLRNLSGAFCVVIKAF